MRRVILLLWVAVGLPAAPAAGGDLFGDLPYVLDRLSDLGDGRGEIQARARDLDQILRSIQTRATSEAALSGSAPNGFRYVINDFGFPERETTGQGTVFVERAEPLGRGRLTLSLSYTHLDYSTFSGTGLDDLFDLASPGLSGEYFGDFDLKTDIVTLGTSYGVTDRLDVGALIPYIWHRSKGDWWLRNPGQSAVRIADADGRSDGFGDVVLHSKFSLLHGTNDWSWALGLKVKTPTGDESESLGTGETDITVRTLVTKRVKQVEFNGELGYTWSGFGRDADYLTYNVSANYSPADWLTFVAEVLGSESELAIYDTLDLAAGVRFNLIDRLVLQTAVRVPLDDSGLRTRVTPMVLLEYRF